MTPQEERKNIIKDFELKWEDFTELQKENYIQYFKDMEDQIPKDINYIRINIGQKIKKILNNE